MPLAELQLFETCDTGFGHFLQHADLT